MSTLWPRLCRGVGLFSALAFLALAFTPAAGWLHGMMLSRPDEQPADAIVVLGASVSSDGLLDDASLRRTIAGVQAQRRGLAPVILLLGARHGAAVEAEVRAGLARDLGVQPEAIRTEARALTTHQEAQRAAELLLPQHARRVLLVTGEYHASRARALFERAGFAVATLPVREVSAASGRPEARLTVARRALTETLARGLARIFGRV
jgi:uncharacterized SAM-binding protein YcdF (DUF218 family)